MSRVTINGTTYEVPAGSTVVVTGNTLTIGSSVSITGLTNTVKVLWEGPVGNLECNTCEINGSVAGSVKGNTITCGTVGGDVKGNTVDCGEVKGSVKANVVSRR